MSVINIQSTIVLLGKHMEAVSNLLFRETTDPNILLEIYKLHTKNILDLSLTPYPDIVGKINYEQLISEKDSQINELNAKISHLNDRIEKIDLNKQLISEKEPQINHPNDRTEKMDLNKQNIEKKVTFSYELDQKKRIVKDIVKEIAEENIEDDIEIIEDFIKGNVEDDIESKVDEIENKKNYDSDDDFFPIVEKEDTIKDFINELDTLNNIKNSNLKS
jgi:hypothetical protein